MHVQYRSNAIQRAPCKFFPILALFKYPGSLLTDGQKWIHMLVNTGISLVQALPSRMILGASGMCLPRAYTCVALLADPALAVPLAGAPPVRYPMPGCVPATGSAVCGSGKESILSLCGKFTAGAPGRRAQAPGCQ